MRRTPAEHIVEFLSYSTDASGRALEFGKFSRRQWESTFKWLDFSGLAFYFLQKLKDTNTLDTIPAWWASRLQQNFEANQQRVGYMTERFACLNQKFDDAGVRYAVLKGLSLVPQFCDDPLLRYQGDFDYLVDDRSVMTARQILVEAGYRAKWSSSSQEFIFVLKEMDERSRSVDQYYAQTLHAVELHLNIWDSDLDGAPLIPKLFFVGRGTSHHFNDLAFPALADEDAFLLQVLHTCHHVFSHWVRMSCLFEIGHFLTGRGSDVELWNRIEQRVGESLVLREFVVIVTELAANLFAVPIPQLVRDWGSRIRPGPRIWVDHYARLWAFGEMPIHHFSGFPRGKLVGFLRQQYRDAAPAQLSSGQRALPPSRLSRVASSFRKKPWLVLDVAWWRRYRLIESGLFHVLARLRYICEIPRWCWLNRAKKRSAAQDFSQLDSLDHRLPLIPDGKSGSSRVA